MPNDDELIQRAKNRNLRVEFQRSLTPPESRPNLIRGRPGLDTKVDEHAERAQLEEEIQRNVALREQSGIEVDKELVKRGQQPSNRIVVATTREDVEQLTAQRALVGLFRDFSEPLTIGQGGIGRQTYRRENKVVGGVREALVPLLVSKAGALIGQEISTNATATISSTRSI